MDSENRELVALKGQVTKVEQQAQNVKIETKEQYVAAADLIARIKEIGAQIKEKKASIVNPLNEALRNARSLFAPIEEHFDNAEDIIKEKLLDYKHKVDAEAKEKEQKIAQRVEAGTMKVETAERKLDTIERIGNTTKGKVGEVQVRKIQRVAIVNEKLIPREYLIPDMVAIRRDALGGKNIPGVEVFEEEVVAAGLR